MPGDTLDALVIEALASAPSPLGAYHLADALRQQGHRPAMMSLYRSLDRLCAGRRVERVATLAAFRIRDVPNAALMICVECGATCSLAVAAERAALEDAIAGTGFMIGTLVIEAIGLCPACGDREE